MMDDHDNSQDEWTAYAEAGLRLFSMFAAGYSSAKRVQEIVKQGMVYATRGKDVGQVASAFMLGASRRNLGRLEKKRTLSSDLTLSTAVVLVLAQAHPHTMSAYEVMQAVNKYEHLDDVDQRRIEEVLEWAIQEEWVVKQGRGYRLPDKSYVQRPSSLSSRRNTLASHGIDLLEAIHAYLRGEEAARFHVVRLVTSDAHFLGLMECIHQAILKYAEEHRLDSMEYPDEAKFTLFFLTRKKPH